MADSSTTDTLARSVAESILASPRLDATFPPAVSLVSLSSSRVPRPKPDLSATTEAFSSLKISSSELKEAPELESKIDNLCNLFVGDLARTVSEDQLKESFSKYGDVVAVDIKRDKITQNNLGYGFVQFKTREQAIKARDALHGTEVGGRKIRIGWAQKNTTLFIGDLDGTVTTSQLRDLFAKFGSIVEEETFVKAGSGKFGFVRFKHRIDAERAKAEMNRKTVGSRPIRIGWGDNNIQKHCVHVQFNPTQGAHLQESNFRKHFEQFGVVQNVSLPRFANRRLKGYGFVHFQENNEGEKAAGKAIATLAESKVANVPIRCSYGKRQIYNRYRRHPKSLGVAGVADGSFPREPIYSQAWAITMGPPTGWPMQYGAPTTLSPLNSPPSAASVAAAATLSPLSSPLGPTGSVPSAPQSPYFLPGRRFSHDQTPVYLLAGGPSTTEIPLSSPGFYPSMRSDTDLTPLMLYSQQGPSTSSYSYPAPSGYDDLAAASEQASIGYSQSAAAQAFLKQAYTQQFKPETLQTLSGMGSLGGLSTPSSPLAHPTPAPTHSWSSHS